jgi:hypothetical protein
MKVWAYDIETILNCFTATFINVKDEKDYRQFVVSTALDHIGGYYPGARELQLFLANEVNGLVSFNGINFDTPITAGILRNGDEYVAYQTAQKIINGEKIKGNLLTLPELDLFLLYHFNNESRRTSLKWIQCHLGMRNIQEMPHGHDQPVTTLYQLQQILSYNFNDVLTTVRFYNHKKTKDLIQVRMWARKTYGIECLNSSNAHMGEMIFMRQMGQCPAPDTEEQMISLSDLILPEINFKSKEFQEVLMWFRKQRFSSKDEGKKSGITALFRGMKYEFGFGGIHAAREESHWEGVHSLDVKSFYPNLAIRYKFRPDHLGEDFTKTYSKLYEDRMKSTTPIANNALKEALNSVFGKSNSIYSPLYDPKMMYSITVNGQLLMAMLAERMELNGAGTVVMTNTDGMEVKVSNYDQYERTLEGWKKFTKMPVATTAYKKLMIKDVNNYIGIGMGDKVKSKGAYVIDKEWNKDPSMRIAAIAVQNWFVHGTKIDTSVRECRNVEDFYMFKRSKTGKMVLIDNYGNEQDAPKTIRYLITNVGFTLMQETDKIRSKVHSKGYVTIMNNLDEAIENYHINYKWYILEAKKLVVAIKEPTLWGS